LASETITNTKRKRPVLVWLISGFLVLAVVGGNVYFLAHLFGMGSNATYAAGLSDLTATDYVRRIVAALLSLSAAVFLFLLRKVAVALFLVMLGLAAALIVYSVSVGVSPPGSFVLLIFPALMSWYAWRLKKRGILV
jgi:hypothetical protein